MTRRLLLYISFLFLTFSGVAQQFPLYSQYYGNSYIVNPGVAGSYGNVTPIRLAVHKQWLNINGSPSTQFLSAHHLLKNEKVGLGGMIFHDHFGPTRLLGLNFTYAYHLNINRNTRIGLGLTGSLMQYIMKLSQSDFHDYEPILNRERVSMMVPEAHFGAFVYHEDYYAGLSITQLFQSKLSITENWMESNNQMIRHYFLMAGYRYSFPYTRHIQMEPSLMLRGTEPTPFQLDANLTIYFYEDFWFGISVRPDDSFVGMVGIQFDHYYFSLSHDFTFSDINNVTMGSQELVFGWNINDKHLGHGGARLFY